MISKTLHLSQNVAVSAEEEGANHRTKSLFLTKNSFSLRQKLQGVTLVAFGNGSVDIFAAIAGMRQGRPDLVVGALLGGGAFVTLFVIGSIFALSKKFKLQGQIFVRDCVFYLLAISWIFYCFVGPKEIALRDAIGETLCEVIVPIRPNCR